MYTTRKTNVFWNIFIFFIFVPLYGISIKYRSKISFRSKSNYMVVFYFLISYTFSGKTIYGLFLLGNVLCRCWYKKDLNSIAWIGISCNRYNLVYLKNMVFLNDKTKEKQNMGHKQIYNLCLHSIPAKA